MWSDQVASVKRSYKAQYQGKEKEEGKRKDGKTTSESGPVSTSTAVREQLKTVRDGRRVSPMSAVAPLRPWWFPDTGIQKTRQVGKPLVKISINAEIQRDVTGMRNSIPMMLWRRSAIYKAVELNETECSAA